MKKNNWIVPGLIIVGISLILFSTWIPQQKFQLSFNKKHLAKILEKNGTVTVYNNEMPVGSDVKLNDTIESRDTIRTDTQSEALVEFLSGGQFRIAEKSEALLDKLDNGQSLIVVKNGDIFIEKFGGSPSFWVRKDGQLYSAVDYALIDKKNTAYLNEPIPESDSKEQISQIEIESVLNSKKNDFFKCFGQLMQKNPQASGQVLLAFTIEKQGHTARVEISSSEISDVSFKSCLMEVVARTRFRPFSGNPVATVFPLKFE